MQIADEIRTRLDELVAKRYIIKRDGPTGRARDLNFIGNAFLNNFQLGREWGAYTMTIDSISESSKEAHDILESFTQMFSHDSNLARDFSNQCLQVNADTGKWNLRLFKR